MPLWEKTGYDRWSLGFDDRTPIYRQIMLRFCQSFVRGDIEPGERIPSIREMSALLKVNTNTMQRVYLEMEREQLIDSKRGTGYFFTEDKKMIEKTRLDLALGSLGRFMEEMRALGCSDREILNELETYIKGEKKNANRS
ncbi:MAG: GntR family transcriptional regulator [Treponema sp.]|nr:GntR family transcriptional regulator [Treponema sp.]